MVELITEEEMLEVRGKKPLKPANRSKAAVGGCTLYSQHSHIEI